MIYDVSSKEEILNLAKDYDVISFDIFDTLIMRELYSPEDVFEILDCKVENNYGIKGIAEYRKRAILESSIPNPNIYQVYDKFKELSGVSDEVQNYVLNMELEIEKQVLICRKQMVEVFDALVSEGKKVILITDMYLPKEVLETFLSGLGIGGYTDLIVSCEWRSLKCENLFSLYMEKHKAKRYLHIGDNYQSDNICADKEGIDSIHINSAHNLYLDSDFSKCGKLITNLSQRNIIGHLKAVVFNNPFKKSNIQLVFEEVAYILVTPIILFIFLKIIRIAKEKEIKTVLLASRDGYLISRLFMDKELNKYIEGIRAEYFYTSRKAVTEASAIDQETILWLSRLPFEGGINAVLQDVFGLAIEDFDDAKKPEDYILSHLSEIIATSKIKKKNYESYISSLCIDEKALFFDLISTGTCQLFLRDYFGMSLYGIYLVKQLTTEKRREELESISLFTSKKSDCFIEAFHHFFEKIITSVEPSLRGFNNKGEPVFSPEYRNRMEIDYICSLQNQIIDFVKMLLFCETSVIDGLDVIIETIAGTILKVGYIDEISLYDDWMKN